MSFTRVAVGVVLLGSLAAAGSAARNPQQVIDQMAGKFSSVNDYDVRVDSVSLEGGKEEKKTYRFAFKKPRMIRLRVISGEGKDGEMCVRPDGKIRGRKNSGLLKAFAIT